MCPILLCSTVRPLQTPLVNPTKAERGRMKADPKGGTKQITSMMPVKYS